ncbi:HD domain-containing protein [Methylobacterium oryzae CBMB20]
MPDPVAIGDIVAPDSALSRKAAELAARAHAPALLNHVHRTWWFGEFIGRRHSMKYDRELVYVASLLHDLGLSHRHAGDKRFEVDGADAAGRFLREHDYPADKAELVWDAIALHSSADIADRREPEVALVHFGAHVDVMGLRLDEIPRTSSRTPWRSTRASGSRPRSPKRSPRCPDASRTRPSARASRTSLAG